MGIKCGYSSPQTLTDQSTAIKRGEKGDLQVLRPHIMCCVPVDILIEFFYLIFFSLSLHRRFSIVSIELGRAMPSMKSLDVVAVALDTTATRLLHGVYPWDGGEPPRQ